MERCPPGTPPSSRPAAPRRCRSTAAASGRGTGLTAPAAAPGPDPDERRRRLERQRTTANDLQNILYSTDVATVFLDLDLGIRFFTPATKALFNIIPSDIGRPLADYMSEKIWRPAGMECDAFYTLESEGGQEIGGPRRSPQPAPRKKT